MLRPPRDVPPLGGSLFVCQRRPCFISDPDHHRAAQRDAHGRSGMKPLPAPGRRVKNIASIRDRNVVTIDSWALEEQQ